MIAVATSGEVSVSLTDSDGCTASDTVNVTVLADLVVDLGADINTTLCTGSIPLDAGVSGMTYLWSTGETS